MEVEVQGKEAEVQVLHELEIGIVLDLLIGRALERALPVDRAIGQRLAAFKVGRDDREDHPLDLRLAPKVGRIGDELQPLPWGVGRELERTGPHRIVLEVQVWIGGGHRVDRRVDDRGVHGLDAVHDLADVQTLIHDPVRGVRPFVGKTHPSLGKERVTVFPESRVIHGRTTVISARSGRTRFLAGHPVQIGRHLRRRHGPDSIEKSGVGSRQDVLALDPDAKVRRGEARQSGRERECDGQVVHLDHLVQDRVEADRLIEAAIAAASQRIGLHDIVGRQRRAVVKRHAGADLDRPGEAVGRDGREASRKDRDGSQSLIVPVQTVIQERGSPGRRSTVCGIRQASGEVLLQRHGQCLFKRGRRRRRWRREVLRRGDGGWHRRSPAGHHDDGEHGRHDRAKVLPIHATMFFQTVDSAHPQVTRAEPCCRGHR